MDALTIGINIVVVVVLLWLVLRKVQLGRTHCEWYYDEVKERWRTQCGSTTMFADNTSLERDKKWIKENKCMHCGKPVTINPIKRRSSGRP